MQHFSSPGPVGAVWRRGWLVLACLLGFGPLASAQTTTIGATAVPVVAPATSSFSYGPLYRSGATSAFNYSRYAHLYTPAELNIPPGSVITALAWLKSDAGEITGNNVFNVLLANSSLSTLGSSQTWGTLSTGATPAYASTTQQVTGAAGAYFSVTLTQPFTYSGGNLLVLSDHEKQGTATAAVNFVTNPAVGFGLGIADGTAFTAATALTSAGYGNRRPTLRLTYAPGTACTAPPSAGTILAPTSAGCAGTPVTLSLLSATFGTGLTYQWQESTNGTTFTDVAGATGPSYTVASLTATRSFRARVTCGGQSATSAPVTITVTAPVYATLPVTESFENTWLSRCDTRDVPTASWRNIPTTGDDSWRRDDDGPSANWVNPNTYSYSPTGSQGTRSARFHSGQAVNGQVGAFDLFVNLSAAGAKRLSFDFINTSGSDSLTVQLSNDGGATFSHLASYNLSGTTSVFSSRLLPISSTSATAVVRFRGVADFGFTDIGLDNVVLESSTGCITPANLSVTATTATTATVSWLAGGTGTYSLIYGPTGFNPASGGTTVSGLAGPPYTITGLTAGTAYQFYVLLNCPGGASSTLAGPANFSTACTTPAYAALPVTESFDNTWLSRCDTRDVPTASWRNTPATGNNSWRRDDDGPSANWTSATAGSYTPNASQGNYSARFHSYFASTGQVGTLDLFVNLSAAGAKRLSFDFVNATGSDSLTVQLSNDGGATFSRLAGYNLSAAFSNKVLPISSTSATAVVRFRGVADFGFSDIGLDNIVLESATGCLIPAGLTATTTTTTAALSWLGGGTGTYTVVYGPAGFNPATGGTTVSGLTAPPLNITGLTPGTTYQFYVTLNCGAGTNSGTAGPISFATQILNDDPCGATTLALNNTCTPLATTTVGATTTASTVYGPGGAGTGCGFNATPRDVWFKFVTAATGATSTQVRIAVSGGAASVVRAYSGAACTGPLTYLSCSGTANGTAAPDLNLVGLTPSTTYYVRVSEYGGTAGLGNFTICATPIPNCPLPTGLVVGALTGSTAVVSWATPPTAGYTFTVVYGPSGFTVPAGGTTITGLTTNSTTLTGLTPNTPYQFYVQQVCGGSNGSSPLAGPAGFTTPLAVPANDEPCGATALFNTVLNGSNVGATTSIQPGITLPACAQAAQPKDVWFVLTPGGTATTLALNGSAAGAVRIYSSPSCSAGPFTLVFCQASGANDTGFSAPIAVTGLTAGQRYYVAISGYGSADTQGAFTLGATNLVITGTKAQANTEALVVYPNPSSTGQLTLRLSGVGGAGQAVLLNALGQVVGSKALSGAPEQTLTTRGLATGVYTLRVAVAGQVLTRKVVLE